MNSWFSARSNPLIGLINTARLVLVLCMVALMQLLDTNIIELQSLGIAAFLYATALSVLPLDRTRSRSLSYLITLLDTSILFLFVDFSGDLASPFLMLFVFPVVGMAVMYGVRSALTIAAFVVLYSVLHLAIGDNSPDIIRNLLINAVLLTFFALYFGSIVREIKLRARSEVVEQHLNGLEQATVA